MKAKTAHRFVSLIAGTSGMMLFNAVGSLQAADWYWNPGGAGGDGIWGTSPGEKNWNVTPGAPTGNIAWPGTIDDVAVFQSITAGIVTVSDPLQTSGIIQNGADYTINAGTITLVPDSGAVNPHIDVQGGMLTIDSVLAGSNGLIKNGGGTLVLTGSNTYSGNTQIGSGILKLAGSLASGSLSISSGASLLNQNGGLSNSTLVTNAGSLTLNADDTITSYISNGGTLTNGPGTLFTASTALNDGSTVAGLLNTGTLTSDGAVQVTGTITANSINIATGTLTNTGTLGNASTLLNISGDATLAAGGILQYSLLSTSGAGAGKWLGNLDNTSAVAPGGLGGIGLLSIEGNYTQAPAGTLKLDLSGTQNDRLDVTGSATFNGALELNQMTTPIAPFVPITVVSAQSGYAGNITSLVENLDGAVWFNPGNGTVTRIGLPTAGGSFTGSTRNQVSTWISLYDDVIDPGITNITAGPGGINITSGLADPGNPDLQWALSASFAPTGLNAALLNRLSPEVYGGLSDYAMQATRAHQRSALSAPALEPGDRTGSKGGLANSAKGGITDTAAPLDWEFFAAADYFRAGTDNSHNQADYDFDGAGMLAGARTRPWDQAQFAVYFGADTGTIDGDLIDADASGWNSGAIAEYLLDEKSRTRLTAGMSYGSYVFDGTRGSASATAAGWAPGNVAFDDVDVDAFDLFVGVDGVAWKQETLTLIPSAGLRYAMTRMDSLNESTGGAPGSPIALDVSRDRHESLLLEMGLLAQVEVNPKLVLWGEGGANIGLLDDGRALGAAFATGSRGMRAEADGLDDDSLYLGCGAVYQISRDISACIGYRADVRSGAEAQQELRLSSSWRF
jgi:autotransporter-associated beta strand protein